MTNGLLRFLFFFLLYIVPAEATDVEAQWKRAVDWVEDGRNWTPAQIETKIHELDRTGQALSREVIEVVQSAEGASGIRRTVKKATKDGADVAASRAEKINGVKTLEEIKAKQREQDLKGNPFARAVQADLTVTDLGRQETIQGRLCQKVSFLRKVKRKEIFKGWAWIDVENGQPIRAHVEVLDRPWLVKSLVSEISYGPIGEGAWGVQILKIKGHGGMLGMSRYFETILQMKEHWR